MLSFAYLLSPGGQFRSVNYPNPVDRARAHLFAGSELNIACPPSYADAFDGASAVTDDRAALWLKTADVVSESLWPELLKDAKSATFEAGCGAHLSDESTRKVKECFEAGVPTSDRYGMAAILNAGWEFVGEAFSSWEDKYPYLMDDHDRREAVLSDLILKSIEVSTMLDGTDDRGAGA